MTSRRDFIKTGVLATTAGALSSHDAVAQPASGISGQKSYAEVAKPKAWTLPQRKSPPVSIDVHTHWAPEAYLKAKADLGQPDALDPINYDMDRRRKWMDEHGVQTLVLTLGGFRPWAWVTPEQGAHIARVTNDAAIEAHTAFPQRFVAGIELNCSDPVGSLAELNRVAGKPGMVCVHLPTALAGQEFLYGPAFAPVLARTEQLGLPILLHPLDGEPNWFAGHRLTDQYSSSTPIQPSNRFPGLTNSLGNSLEVAVAMSKLIVTGTLDKFPGLNFIMVCGGGAFPYAAGRVEYRSGQGLKRPFYEYLRQFYYDSLVYSPASLRYLVEVVGSDRVVLGTDNMFGPGSQMEEPHAIIDQANLPDKDRDLVLRGNLQRLFKI